MALCKVIPLSQPQLPHLSCGLGCHEKHLAGCPEQTAGHMLAFSFPSPGPGGRGFIFTFDPEGDALCCPPGHICQPAGACPYLPLNSVSLHLLRPLPSPPFGLQPATSTCQEAVRPNQPSVQNPRTPTRCPGSWEARLAQHPVPIMGSCWAQILRDFWTRIPSHT